MSGTSASPPPNLRPSRPPHAPTPVRHAGRIAFMVAWLALQTGLVLTADRRADGAFGFRMFSESTSMRLSLFREITSPEGRTLRVRVEDGAWEAKGAGGFARRFAWGDHVGLSELATLDQEVQARHPARAELERLQAALDDVAAHLGDEVETRRLLLDVTLRRNGREPQIHHLASRERAGGT